MVLEITLEVHADTARWNVTEIVRWLKRRLQCFLRHPDSCFTQIAAECPSPHRSAVEQCYDARCKVSHYVIGPRPLKSLGDIINHTCYCTFYTCSIAHLIKHL